MIPFKVADRSVSRSAWSILAEIGRDAALEPEEMSPDLPCESELLRSCWTAYERDWGRFCGTQLDPQCWRLSHPARWTGLPRVTGAAPVVIVGTGPSLAVALDELSRCRNGLHIFTSPRGADALADAGIAADLVLIEHQTPLDAYFSVQAFSQRGRRWGGPVPLIATDARTPAALLTDVPQDRLIVLNPMPTWGLWPATAAALAMAAGASTVALLGIDLGTTAQPDPQQGPLIELLRLLTIGTDATCVDVGRCAAAKPGWTRDALAAVASVDGGRSMTLDRGPWTTVDDRVQKAEQSWRETSGVVDEARAGLDVALRVRAGDRARPTLLALRQALDRLWGWRSSSAVRQHVQAGLGCSYLPRLWRVPPDPALGPLLWRPLALSAHELVHQHGALGAELSARGIVR